MEKQKIQIFHSGAENLDFISFILSEPCFHKMHGRGVPVFLVNALFPAVQIQLVKAEGDQLVFRLHQFPVSIPVAHADAPHDGAFKFPEHEPFCRS